MASRPVESFGRTRDLLSGVGEVAVAVGLLAGNFLTGGRLLKVELPHDILNGPTKLPDPDDLAQKIADRKADEQRRADLRNPAPTG